MARDHYDLIVLGGGSAARDGAKRAAEQYGAKVALVERTRWGGSCPNVACKPTKAYLVAAELLRDMRTLGPKIGVEPAAARADLRMIRAWKDSLLKPQERWVAELEENGFDTYTDEASFVDPRTVRVGDRELVGDRILIATGSRTAVPPIPGLERLDWLDHVTALELDELPASLLVLGGGAVGLELAQVFARFGSRVTIVQSASQVAPRSDADAAAALAAALADEGIEIHTSSVVERFEGSVAIVSDGSRVDAARVVLATGRDPNIEELGLDRIGVRTHRAGIEVNDRMRTSVAGIWAAGDVTAVAQFTPAAQYQARIAVADMFGANGRSADYSLLPTAIFTDPELAAVGLDEDDAQKRGHSVATSTHPVAHVTRSQYVQERHGLYKLVFDRDSRRVLGVHVVSRNASDVVQGLAVALEHGATVDDLAAAHHIYPSWGEGVKAAAEQAPPALELERVRG